MKYQTNSFWVFYFIVILVNACVAFQRLCAPLGFFMSYPPEKIIFQLCIGPVPCSAFALQTLLDAVLLNFLKTSCNSVLHNTRHSSLDIPTRLQVMHVSLYGLSYQCLSYKVQINKPKVPQS